LITIGAQRTPSAMVGIIMLTEAILGPIWAWLFINEQPPFIVIIGISTTFIKLFKDREIITIYTLLIPFWRNSIVHKLIVFIIKLQLHLCYKFWYSSLLSIIGISNSCIWTSCIFWGVNWTFRRNEIFKR